MINLNKIMQRRATYKSQRVLEMLSRNIMKASEGTASGRVGTATVPARIRLGSRIMKNSL